tara:strand:- start:1205 stop:1651 length:447 start_codon:yes stop_codon:yes gene_type:complete
MMTYSVNSYIKDVVVSYITFYDELKTFDEIYDGAIHTLFNDDDNNDDDNWCDYGEPPLDEFMTIQHDCYNYLESCGSLDIINEKQRDWKWWFNIYAVSGEWRSGDMKDLEEECFVNCYESQIILLQSNIRRRQATIRTIKKLHLTGSL